MWRTQKGERLAHASTEKDSVIRIPVPFDASRTLAESAASVRSLAEGSADRSFSDRSSTRAVCGGHASTARGTDAATPVKAASLLREMVKDEAAARSGLLCSPLPKTWELEAAWLRACGQSMRFRGNFQTTQLNESFNKS